MQGRFIVLEGVDGSGKTSLAKRLAVDIGDAWITFEPTDGKIGSALRLGEYGDIPPVAEALLFTADRSVHTLEIKRELVKGRWVICDRYMGSTVAYQSAAMGADADWDWLIAMQKDAVIEPDAVVFLDADPEVSMSRVGTRGEDFSRFEKIRFQRKVREAYLRLAHQFDYIVIDASADVETVYRKMKEALERKGLFASERRDLP